MTLKRFFYIVACLLVSVTTYKFTSYFFQQPPSDVSIILQTKVLKDDTFQLFYQTESAESFSEGASVRTTVKGEDRFQQIVFTLPIALDLKKIRIDLGDQLNAAEEVEQIWITSITIANSTDSYVFSGDSLVSFFHPVLIDKFSNDGLVVTKRYGDVYDPSIESDSIASLMVELKKPTRVFLLPVLVTLLFSAIVSFCIFTYSPSLTRSTVVQRAFIFVFLLLLTTPAVTKYFHLFDEQMNLEKRVLVQRPSFSMTKTFAEDFEKYYNDNFGMRDYFIGWSSFLKVTVFRTPPNPEKVMIGKDNWLFYNHSGGAGDYMFRSYTHLNALPLEELKQYVATLEERQRFCKDSGITYIKGFWPQTHTIYSEYLPLLMNIQLKDAPSRADQIIDYIKETKSPFRFIDVRAALIGKKSEAQLYHKLDTHWNQLGAFIGYQSFFDQCYPDTGVKPKSLAEFKITWKKTTTGDLTKMLGLRYPSFFEEMEPIITSVAEEIPFEYLPTDGYPALTKITLSESCPDKRRVLIFRDSYTDNLERYFSRQFREVFYVWGGYDQKIVDRIQPQLVIEVPVERYL